MADLLVVNNQRMLRNKLAAYFFLFNELYKLLHCINLFCQNYQILIIF